jgi:hypothetical protein
VVHAAAQPVFTRWQSEIQRACVESTAAANAGLKCEIAIVNSDGTGAVVWGVADVSPAGSFANGELSTTDTATLVWVSGDDTVVGTGGTRDQTDHSSLSAAAGDSVVFQQYAVQHNGGTLSEVRAWLAQMSTGSLTDNLIIEIQTDSGGNPSGTAVATIATLAGSSLTVAQQQFIFTGLGTWRLALTGLCFGVRALSVHLFTG